MNALESSLEPREITVHSPAGPPRGPKGLPLLGSYLDIRNDRLGFLTRCARTYGDIVPFRVGWEQVYLLNHPDLIEQVLVKDYRRFTKGRGLRVVVGNGLVNSDGSYWRKQRKLIQPAFHRERIAGYARDMVGYTEQMLQTWPDTQTRDVYPDMIRLTMRIVSKTLFGIELEEEVARLGGAVRTVQDMTMRRIFSLLHYLPTWFPAVTNLRLQRALGVLDSLIYGIIRKQKACPEKWDNVLSSLMQIEDEDGERMTDRQLRDEALTVFLGGQESAANVLAFALHLLAEHPEADRRLTAELETELGGRTPTFEDRARLRYVEWAVMETMRLYPSALLLTRNVPEDTTVGGHTLRAGSTVTVSQWVTHRDPRYFDEPEAFRPERWAGDFAKTLPRYAYFPFGGGPRVCIGNTFAMMEMVLVLATILQQYRFDPVPGHPVALQAAINLRPKNGIRLQVCRR